MTKNITILFTPNCVGGRHGVSLIRRGRKLSLTLHSHGENSDFPIETVRSFQALDPEFRCRCLEILDSWKFYTRASPYRESGSMPFREFYELYPWGKDAFFKKLSGKDLVTPSMVLSILPKEFREEAKASRALRGKRQRDKEIFLVDRSGNPELMPRWAKGFFHGSQGGRSSRRILPAESFVDRCGHTDWKKTSYWEEGHHRKGECLPRGKVSSMKLNRYLQKLLERHGNFEFSRSFNLEDCIDSLLGTNDSCTYGTRKKGDVHRRTTRLRWLRLYWKYQWMKELVRAGYIPVDIPPKVCWEYDREGQPLYPRIVSIIKYAPEGLGASAGTQKDKGAFFKRQFNLYSIRLMETHADEGKKFFYTSFAAFGSRFDT